jgi:hypothetical protein
MERYSQGSLFGNWGIKYILDTLEQYWGMEQYSQDNLEDYWGMD